MSTAQTLSPRDSRAESEQDRPVPILQTGDRLTSEEFLRRYRAMPHVHNAELIEGRVYMASPVSAKNHGEPHSDVLTWLGVYRAHTPGVRSGDNSTTRLDVDNAPQPDCYLRLLPELGGPCSWSTTTCRGRRN